ncbi:MAG: tetratricopeptide repeat protein [Elusimicrobia bacterium]|nr:tetratricopeptide repeat protein [Elusimicrobiota bacterium]
MRLATLTVALLIALAPPVFAESFASWMKDADKASRRSRHARAAECYGNALRLWKKGDGGDAKLEALKAKASAHAVLKQWPDALRDLTEAIRLASKDKDLLLRRGRAYAETGRERKAITDLSAAIALDIDYKEAYLARGRAYQKLGDKKFAKEDFGHACELGLTDACSLPARPKPTGGAPRKPAAENPETADASDPLDAPACFAFLDKCFDEGDSFGSCVSKLDPCEKNPVKGCCPDACRKAFAKSQEEQGISEAEAFRQVFRRGNPCLKRR